MSNQRIRYLLESRLAERAARLDPAIPVAYENVRFSPSGSGIRFEAYLLPATTVAPDLEGKYRIFSGVFQITVIAPRGVGMGRIEEVAELICDLFPCNLRLSMPQGDPFFVQVITPPTIAIAFQRPESVALPVSFNYWANQTR